MRVELWSSSSASKNDAVISFHRVLFCQTDKLHQMNSPGLIVDLFKSALNHFNQGRFAEAEAGALKVTSQLPSLGDAWKILGVSQYAQEKDAISALMRASELLPIDAQIHTYLGAEFLRLGQIDLAEQHLMQAFRIDPQTSLGLYHLGRLRSQQGKWQEAVALLGQASLAKDGVPGTLFELGNAQFNLGRFDEAERSFRKSAANYPDQLEAQVGLGMVLLLKGYLSEGFRLFEGRWKIAGAPSGAKFSFPQWNGYEELSGKSLLFLCAEQGFGDSIQFVRFAKFLEQRGATVSIAVNKELSRLFTLLDVTGKLYTDGAVLPSFDYWCYAMSVPVALGTSLNTIPFSGGYLPMPTAKRAEGGRLRVGLAWQGNSRHKNDKRRSIHLKTLSPLLETENVEFVSLQKELLDDDAKLCDELGLRLPRAPLRDFMDTAELISTLDIVVSVDSSVAHLGGALGRETWLMLPAIPDWRWLLDRNDSPWYDSMRLFRQPIGEDWSFVVDMVTSQLQQRVNAESA